ncbi:MAG TPA: phosphopyruvate hydratase [Pirellulales bacterium]|jgi:enolase|nr:phosphopyruvate hydratase [Pirellulales bacterium]
MNATIQLVRASEILDSRGNPTIQVRVELSDGTISTASVPSGASTGTKEAVELRDGDSARYGGKGVLKAVANVNDEIGRVLVGRDPTQHAEVDRLMIDLDGTPNKARLGANAILGVSMAAVRAAVASKGVPLYEHLGSANSCRLPVPMFNILNGGRHADNSIDLQEFMIAPVGAPSFAEAVRYGAETYHALKAILKSKGYVTAVGDEGGFAPNLKANVEAVELIIQAIERAGFRPGVDIAIALDPAASEFYENGSYVFAKSDHSRRSSDEMISFYEDWIQRFPICLIEDGLSEEDWKGWKALTDRLGGQIRLVGDDIFCTNPGIIRRAIQEGIANEALIKLNQIGTVTETLEAIAVAHAAGYGTFVSHRSGETADDFIADLAVAAGSGQIKSGAPCRGERLAKYNRLMQIERELGSRAIYAGRQPFNRNNARPD